MNKVKAYLHKNWFWLAVNLAVAMPLLLLGWDWIFRQPERQSRSTTSPIGQAKRQSSF